MAHTPFRGLLLLAFTLLWGGVALAQSADDPLPDADPPDRAARLSYILGDVSMQPAGEEEWAPAIINRPLTTGDKLWTEQNARVEIHVGATAVRLDQNTGFSFLNLDDDEIQMRLTAGVINVNVRELEGNDHIEIATPNVAVSLLRAGTYRVEVNDAGDATVVKVGEGSAEATGPGQNVIVHARQQVSFRGIDDVVAQLGTLGAPDEFDSWTSDRERRDERAASSRTAQYVSPDVTGYEDLDDHGSWSSEPEYGYVWTPSRVAVDWSPYRYGRWVWISPWGWTWIDDAPWGYAPFHYGRWAHVRNRWCWVPGPRHVRAVYAPALVGWVGFGTPGLHVSWFPLGPREVYVPYRRFSHRYVERVNVSNTIIIDRRHIGDVYDNRIRDVRYRNRLVPGGVTVVSRTAFTSAGRIGEHRTRVNERDVARAPTDTRAPRIPPRRESHFGGPTRPVARAPRPEITNRQVVVRRDPPALASRFVRPPRAEPEPGRDSRDRVTRPQIRGSQERPLAGNDRPERNRQDRWEREREREQGEVRGDGRPDGGDRAAGLRDRSDRPPREDRPGNGQSQPYRSSVTDPRSIAERVREDGDRQRREFQRQREEQRQDRPDDARGDSRREWRTEDRRVEQSRPEQPRYERRGTEQRAQPRWEQPRVEQPRAEHRRDEPRMQPRMEQPRPPPRAESPRAEQPRENRPARSEPRNEPQPRPQNQGRQGNHSRPSRE